MSKYVALALLLLASLFVPVDTADAKVSLFGGSDHKQYLGCLVCSEYESDSICNGLGTYGNGFSTQGMFNEFSGFGNEFSSESPWNDLSSSDAVPVLVDENGKFYGYFTINAMHPNAVSFAEDLKKLYHAYDGDLEKVRIAICKSFGYSGS